LITSARASRLIGAFAAPWLALIPTIARACPACAGRDVETSLRTYGVLASMIFVPFVVAGVVIQIIRRIESDSSR
jgi:predicted Na+-dependent transporter